ncbi:MAG: hypothetical protein K2P14_04200 [Anaeroplasmataceae bacterium]|nr:hypothetical protein [Anaeroplasmataceae bacterium]
MDYVIKNHKNVYIRLNKNGTPVTCTENEKTLFEESKAKNILDSLPKTLRRLNFKVKAVPNIIQSKPNTTSNSQVIQSESYIVSDRITQWIEKFGICDDILKEAHKRKEELNKIISNSDRAISNWLHEVELEKKKNACLGYLKYSDIKDIVDKRRLAKDEWIIINNILRMDFRNLDREVVNNAVIGLTKRKFTYRMVEEDETENVV